MGLMAELRTPSVGKSHENRTGDRGAIAQLRDGVHEESRHALDDLIREGSVREEERFAQELGTG